MGFLDGSIVRRSRDRPFLTCDVHIYAIYLIKSQRFHKICTLEIQSVARKMPMIYGGLDGSPGLWHYLVVKGCPIY